MAPIKFKDINKTCSDILGDDYQFDRKLKISTKTAAGVSITTEGSLKTKGVSGKLTTKGTLYDGIKIDKAAVDTSGRLFADATLTNLYSGLTATVKVQDGADKDPTGDLIFNYKTPALNLEVGANVVKGPVLSTAGSFAYENFTFGGAAVYNTNFDDDKDAKRGLSDFSAGVQYAANDLAVGLTAKKQFKSFELGIAHAVSPDLCVGAKVAFSSKNSSKSITVGGKKKLAGGNAVAGKVDSNGIVSANWIQIMAPGVKLISSAQVDAKNFAGDSHKMGLALELSA